MSKEATSADLIMKLYDLRREATMRDARNWFISYFPESVEDIMKTMIDPATGGPHTAHTTNPVPFLVVDSDLGDEELRAGGALCDVGPTILQMLGIEQPAEMTGTSLRLSGVSA